MLVPRLFVILMKKAEKLYAKDLQSKAKSKWKTVFVAHRFKGVASSASPLRGVMKRPGTSSPGPINGESVETSNL